MLLGIMVIVSGDYARIRDTISAELPFSAHHKVTR
jgi:hypothetical protein